MKLDVARELSGLLQAQDVKAHILVHSIVCHFFGFPGTRHVFRGRPPKKRLSITPDTLRFVHFLSNQRTLVRGE